MNIYVDLYITALTVSVGWDLFCFVYFVVWFVLCHVYADKIEKPIKRQKSVEGWVSSKVHLV